MPVVIALLNSYSGIAGAATGFVLGNTVLIIAGSLVGASGLILTRIMTKAMNRSLMNVMLGGFGVEEGSAASGEEETRPIRSIQADDAAMMLAYAQSVIFVPGYGLAVAQAQHQVRELADLLKEKGISVRYAMPILNVDAAQSVIMMKRGMSAGFAGVQNELFFLDKTVMLFGDAKDSVEKIVSEVKDL